jgi:probable phosphoglycerate mutase
VLAGLSGLEKAHPDQCIAIVSHAEPIRAAVLYYRGISLNEFARVQIDPGSCTTLQLNGGQSTIVRENAPAEAMMLAA